MSAHGAQDREAIKDAADWLNQPQHDIGFEAHKNKCGAYHNLHDASCERCSVEIALAAYAHARTAEAESKLAAAEARLAEIEKERSGQ